MFLTLTIFIIFLIGYFSIVGLLLRSPYRYTTQARESDDQKNLHAFFKIKECTNQKMFSFSVRRESFLPFLLHFWLSGIRV